MTTAPQRSPHLLIVDDDADLRVMLARRLRQKGLTVTEASTGAEALARAGETRFDLALLDLHLPDTTGVELLARLKEQTRELEVLLLTAHGSIDTAIQAMRQGAYDYLTKPVASAELEARLEKAYEKVRLARRERQWADQLLYESPRYRLVGSSPAMQRVVQLIAKVAPTDATVLIRGPTGTGKELVARALHANSPRRDRPLVTVNCAALQPTLLESELFGHEKGAFTGATQAKRGLIEVAEGSTLFIDEVAEMAPALQAKLLRVLEDGHYRHVGSTHDAYADVRVVAATNRPLEDEQKAGKFREDLYHRLNVITVTLPALRERRQDIPELLEYFLTTRPVGPTRFQVDREALEALTRYDWPGNIRELANVIERAQILGSGDVITLDDLPESIAAALSAPALAEDNPLSLHEAERRHVKAVYEIAQGNKLQAAKLLGINRGTLHRMLKKYGLLSEESQDEETATKD